MIRKFVMPVALIGLLIFAGWNGRRTAATEATTSGARTPVLVELYTSEGCSDCPSADAVLSELEAKQPVPGVEIIPLGLHVDYWNNARWADRFSSHAFSARQNDYAASFHNLTVYTPQMVVDGKTEFVGSDKERAVQAISRAACTPKADIQVSKSGAGDAIRLQVRVDRLPAVPNGDTAQVFLAVTEDGLTSRVKGGENDGRVLHHNAVVRQMGLLGAARPGAVFTASPSVTPAGDWNRERLRAVVFVQAENSRQVLGAAAVPLG